MPRLRDRTPVDCSVERAQQGLERFFFSLRGPDGVSRMHLRVPTDGAAHGYGISFEREVRVEARRIGDPEHVHDLIEVAWAAEGALVFPRFEGRLSVWSDDDAPVTYVELDGSYTPPFGAAGQLFDAAIGHRIAQATAREFLKDLKRAVESL